MNTIRNRDMLDALRDFLVTQALVRIPRVAGATPPLWLEPRDGVPAPGEGANPTEKGDTVVAAFRATGFPSQRTMFPYIRNIGIDFRIRGKTTPPIFDFDAKLYMLLHERYGWDMAGLDVIASTQFRELQRLGSDSAGFEYVTEYQFEVYA